MCERERERDLLTLRYLSSTKDTYIEFEIDAALDFGINDTRGKLLRPKKPVLSHDIKKKRPALKTYISFILIKKLLMCFYKHEFHML